MKFDVERERQRLAQQKFLEWIKCPIRPSEMLTVYLNDKANDHNVGIYCALIPEDHIEHSLKDLSWDLSLGDGLPGAVEYHRDGEKRVEYLRFGDDDGIEPLVIYREFHGMRDDYREISEEFRLFHRLYHDHKQDQYIKIDASGSEHVVVTVEPHRVQIRLQEIRQFLAIKEMHLAVIFDCREHSKATLNELGLEGGGTEHRDGPLAYSLAYGDLSGLTGKRAFSRLLGKRLFPPFPKEKSGFWGFAANEPDKHSDFIIGIVDDGTEITHTSDPDQLANYFGANPGASHYLTPVHFRKQVLDKYYQQSSKFSVEDGYLRCGGLWGMMMDNHHADRVVAWLGDLGRDLPYEEQLHWRSFNIAPTGSVSDTFFRRQILSIATDSGRPEHVFHQRYRMLREASEDMLGWPILLPLDDQDAHYLQALRVPSNDEQKDFDDLVLALTKILVDSLNEKELNKLIPSNERGEIKGSISRLERALTATGVKRYEEHIKFLRNLQNLRSTGTAHRKGSQYLKIAEEFRVDSQPLRAVFEDILVKGLDVLQYLESVVRSGVLHPELD